jgi:hypothetical protein
MESVQEQSDRLNRTGWPNSYTGGRGKWLIVIGQNRDSEVIDRSNFRTAERLFRVDGVDHREGWTIERLGHWACGWVEHIIIDPACPALAKIASDIRAKLEQYPILDEDDCGSLGKPMVLKNKLDGR